MTDETFGRSGNPVPGLAEALLIVWRWPTDRAADENRRRQLSSYTFGYGFAVVCFFIA